MKETTLWLNDYYDEPYEKHSSGVWCGRYVHRVYGTFTRFTLNYNNNNNVKTKDKKEKKKKSSISIFVLVFSFRIQNSLKSECQMQTLLYLQFLLQFSNRNVRDTFISQLFWLFFNTFFFRGVKNELFIGFCTPQLLHKSSIKIHEIPIWLFFN